MSLKSKEIDFQRNLGQKIKEARRKRSLTQADLGRFLNISAQQIQKYEVGSNTISAKLLFEISKACNLPISHFFTSFNPVQETDSNSQLLTNEEIRLLKAFSEIKDTSLKSTIMNFIKAVGKKP